MRKISTFMGLSGILVLSFAIAESVMAEGFDIEAATRAYLDTISAEDKERSDAYFEGGYWLVLWNLLYGIAIAWITLHFRLAVHMRDWAKGLLKGDWATPSLVTVQYLPFLFLLSLPLGIYEGFFREHQYDFATQSFGAWFGEHILEMVILTLFQALVIGALYAAVRKLKDRWWIWGGAIVTVFLFIGMFISPVFIEPLFNDYRPMEDSPLQQELVSMAKANGIPVNNIFVVDESRQTTRISASVAGFGPTTRIALNDNLLNNASDAEIKAVMGHEMGHYVLGHATSILIRIGLIITAGLAFLTWSYRQFQSRYGERWGIGDLSDPAGLPLVFALMSFYVFLMTPLINRVIYSAEVEADIFGLQTAEEPEGAANIALRLGAYRKMEPGPIEEFVFYDHPSGYKRIEMGMTWRAENLIAEDPSD